jgi:spermidine synthase
MLLSGKKAEMFDTEKILFDGNTKFAHYQVIDMHYVGRPARVLFSGQRAAAQSAIPRDGNPAMLFDYNQRFMELVDSVKPKSLLIIGGGAFTLPMQVLEFFPGIKIDVVEQDAELAEIAKRFFGLKEHDNLNIIFGDGREYLKSNKKLYDLIIIDAFSGLTIPPSLSTVEFANLLNDRLTEQGICALNIVSAYHGPNNETLKKHFATHSFVFRHVDIFPADKILSFWISQNFLQTSTNKRLRPKYNLRFGSLQPPIINNKHIQYDK